jgi:hypothetical protein
MKKNYEFFYHLLEYCDRNDEIIQPMIIMMIFNMSKSYLHQISFTILRIIKLLVTKLTLW